MELDRLGIGLRAQDWAALEEIKPCAVYQRHAMVYLQGELADRFYYLKSGRVQIFLSSAQGGEKTLTIREKGSIFGEAAFFDGMPRMSSARTLEKSEIIPIGPAALMEAFQKEPQLAMHMLRFLARTVRMLSSQVDHMTFLQADRRIARLLVGLIKPGADGRPEIQTTHEELGSMAGTSRITASRVLGGFLERGWIETGYRKIRVKDLKALEDFACCEEEMKDF